MVPQSGPPVTRRSWGLLVPLHHTHSVLTLSPSPFVELLFFSIFFFYFFSISFPSLSSQSFPHIPFTEPWYHLVLSFFLFLSFFFSLDLWWLEGYRGGELWCMAAAVILICSHMAKLLLPLAKLSLSYLHSFPCPFLFSHASSVTLGMAMSFCRIVCWFTILVQIEISL